MAVFIRNRMKLIWLGEDAKSYKIDAIYEVEWLEARFTTEPFLIFFEQKFFIIAIEGYLKLRNQTL